MISLEHHVCTGEGKLNTNVNNLGLDIRCQFDVLSNAHSGAAQAWYF